MSEEILESLKGKQQGTVLLVTPMAYRDMHLSDIAKSGWVFKDTVRDGKRRTWLNPETWAGAEGLVEVVRVPGLDAPWRLADATITA